MRQRWTGIEPGDVGFSSGSGLVGFLIRTGTQSAYGHCWVYHRLLRVDENGDEVWETVESFGDSGVRVRERTEKPVKVVRVWRTEEERQTLLRASQSLVGASYGWGEIARIVARIIGIRVNRWQDDKGAVICSNHSAQSILAARPDLGVYLPYPVNEIWPGALALALDAAEWDAYTA